MDLQVQGQPGLQNELQDSQGHIEKLCLKRKKQNHKHPVLVFLISYTLKVNTKKLFKKHKPHDKLVTESHQVPQTSVKVQSVQTKDSSLT